MDGIDRSPEVLIVEADSSNPELGTTVGFSEAGFALRLYCFSSCSWALNY